MPVSFARIAVLCAIAALCAACVNLEPRQSNMRYYVLAGDRALNTALDDDALDDDALDDDARSIAPADTSGWVLGLRRLRLASYLDTPTIVTRLGPHEVHFAEFHRWGEDVPHAINRTVARHLVSAPSIARADVVPWTDRARHDYLVQLHVLRFEGVVPDTLTTDDDPDDVQGLRYVGETGAARMVARWEVVNPTTEAVLHQGTTDRRIDGWTIGRYGDLVQHLDTALQALAGDLARAIDEDPGRTEK